MLFCRSRHVSPLSFNTVGGTSPCQLIRLLYARGGGEQKLVFMRHGGTVTFAPSDSKYEETYLCFIVPFTKEMKTTVPK